jgi:hypothetical protein
MRLCTKSNRYQLLTLGETERPLNIPVSLSMEYGAEAHREEGQFRGLKSTLNKLKSLKFQFGTNRPTYSIIIIIIIIIIMKQCYVEAKGNTSNAGSNIICGSNYKVTVTKSNKT